MRRLLLLALLAAPSVARSGAPTLQCGPHQHVVEERDEDEGSKVKRCVCDEGWDADGPGRPCRQAKPEAPKKPKGKG